MEFLDYLPSIIYRIPEDAWNLFELKGSLWALLFWAVGYWIAKWKNRFRHMQKLKLEARNFATATLIACGIVFLFLLFIYSPYQQYKQLSIESDTTQNDLLEAQAKVKKLEADNKALATANASMAADKQELEKSINNLSAKVERTQSDKQQKAAFIKELCGNENLLFKQSPTAPPSPYDGNRGYAKQIKVWPRFGSSETVIIRINADAVFQLYEKNPEAPEVVTLSGNGHNPSGGYFHEFKLRRGGIKNSPTTITLVNSTSFNVICIDRIPSS